MASKSGIIINRSIKLFEHTNKLQITKAFAENNLSRSALKYAEKTDTHYLYSWGTTSYIVAYELPKLFPVNPGELLRFMVVYCSGYIKDNNLTDDSMYALYLEHAKKDIKL